MKTAHQFARELLSGPDLPVVVPKVVEYDEEGQMLTAVAVEMQAEDFNDQPMQVIRIDGTYAP